MVRLPGGIVGYYPLSQTRCHSDIVPSGKFRNSEVERRSTTFSLASCTLLSRHIECGCNLKELAEPLDRPPQLDWRLHPHFVHHLARCALIVRSVVPSTCEICLLSRPPTTSAKTSRARAASAFRSERTTLASVAAFAARRHPKSVPAALLRVARAPAPAC